MTPGSQERIVAMTVAYLDGTTLEAIGDTWGISRERVRQILKKAGVKSRRNSTRVYPFDPADKRWQQHRPARIFNTEIRRDLWARYKATRRNHIRVLRVLAQELNRTPNARELAAALGDTTNPNITVGKFWTGRPRHSAARTSGMRRLYRLAGLTYAGVSKVRVGLIPMEG